MAHNPDCNDMSTMRTYVLRLRRRGGDLTPFQEEIVAHDAMTAAGQLADRYPGGVEILHIDSDDPEWGKPFEWRDRDGHRHDPRKMETRHLFYTLRMVWNQLAPDDGKIPCTPHHLDPASYPMEYLWRAALESGAI
jgi:hypothetical protein